jgi:hypothetical protein
MIMRWLDEHELGKYKTFIYARTRSFSNLGSSLNAVLSVVLIVYLGDHYNVLFAISIVPFIADFMLVATYPSYMNETADVKKNCAAIMGDTFRALKVVFKKPETRKPLLSSASFMALYTQLKHYIQPIMVVYGGKMLTRWQVCPSVSAVLTPPSPPFSAGITPRSPPFSAVLTLPSRSLPPSSLLSRSPSPPPSHQHPFPRRRFQRTSKSK